MQSKVGQNVGSFVMSIGIILTAYSVLSLSSTAKSLRAEVAHLKVKNQAIKDALLALTRTNWLFKDATLAESGYYTVTVASHDDRNLEIKTLEFTVPATAFSPYLRNMDRYGEPRALKGKPVVFRIPQGPPYGNTLVFDGLMEFAVVQ